MATRPTRLTVATLLSTTALLGLTACGGSREARIRREPTPELDTLHQSDAEVKNAWALMFDENMRMAKQDLGRAFYTDRPSRLTREPVPRP